ncbi:MAG: DsbA family protein, partial [Myxococcales bacterium]|nr:DsbA family protein [Myxococcales bacterium]
QTAIAPLAARRGVALEWAPILLGGLFRAIGTPDVPLHSFHATKRAYVRRDMQDWAALRGVPLRFPSRFPVRTVLPLRVALAEPSVTPHLYRAIWVDDRPVDTPEALGPLLEGLGLDARALLERAQSPEIKQALRRNTEEAEAAGVCGVPTMEVHAPGCAPALFWGQDRLEMAFAAACGWRAEVDRGVADLP